MDFLGKNQVPSTQEIEDSFEQGKAEAKEWKEREDELQSLYDIFKDNIIPISKNPDLFLTTDEVMRLSRFLGRNREKNAPILLTGPQRCGKSTAVQLIENGLKRKYKVLYQPIGDSHQFASWWEDFDFGVYDIVIFDNINETVWGHFVEENFERNFAENNTLPVGILNSSESYLHQMRLQSSIIPFFNQENTKVFQFKRYSVDDIKEMVKKRSESLGYPNFFSKDVIDIISVLSLGLPGLAFWLVRHVLSNQMFKSKTQNITVSTIHEIADYTGFGPALKLIIEHNNRSQHQEMSSRRFWPILKPLQQTTNEFSPLIQYLMKKRQISTSWSPLLEEILLLNQKQENSSIKRSELQERTGIKESSLTYQCQRLVQEKIIGYEKEGREVNYHLRSPAKEALEFIFFG
jgi:hypothetical protein